jgi:hypothetical protein
MSSFLLELFRRCGRKNSSAHCLTVGSEKRELNLDNLRQWRIASKKQEKSKLGAGCQPSSAWRFTYRFACRQLAAQERKTPHPVSIEIGEKRDGRWLVPR